MPRKLVCREDHSVEITRSKELIPAACGIREPRLVDGRLEFDYIGGAEVFWDDQYQVRNQDHERVFLDDDGGEYLESEIEVIDA
jgi:hypothetical protein